MDGYSPSGRPTSRLDRPLPSGLARRSTRSPPASPPIGTASSRRRSVSHRGTSLDSTELRLRDSPRVRTAADRQRTIHAGLVVSWAHEADAGGASTACTTQGDPALL